MIWKKRPTCSCRVVQRADGQVRIQYCAMHQAAPELLAFAKQAVCGSLALDDKAGHACVHKWDDPIAERRCAEARALLYAIEQEGQIAT